MEINQVNNNAGDVHNDGVKLSRRERELDPNEQLERLKGLFQVYARVSLCGLPVEAQMQPGQMNIRKWTVAFPETPIYPGWRVAVDFAVPIAALVGKTMQELNGYAEAVWRDAMRSLILDWQKGVVLYAEAHGRGTYPGSVMDGCDLRDGKAPSERAVDLTGASRRIDQIRRDEEERMRQAAMAGREADLERRENRTPGQPARPGRHGIGGRAEYAYFFDDRDSSEIAGRPADPGARPGEQVPDRDSGVRPASADPENPLPA